MSNVVDLSARLRERGRVIESAPFIRFHYLSLCSLTEGGGGRIIKDLVLQTFTRSLVHALSFLAPSPFHLPVMTVSNGSSSKAETLYANINNNYPLQCFLFEQDLDNYYQPSDPPLELYLGNDGSSDGGGGAGDFIDHYFHYRDPNYHPHYLNYRHLVRQINSRYQTTPFAPHLLDWLDVLKKEEDNDDEGRMCASKTGMYLASGNVVIRYTTWKPRKKEAEFD
jgi:hypothetical protein